MIGTLPTLVSIIREKQRRALVAKQDVPSSLSAADLDDFLDELDDEDRSELLRQGDKQQKTLSRTLLTVLLAAGAAVLLDKVIEAVRQNRHGDLEDALGANTLPEQIGRALERPLAQAAATGGEIAARGLQDAGVDPTIFVRFNLVNLHAVQIARKQAGEMITGMKSDMPDVLGAVKRLVGDAIEQGRTVAQLRTDILPVVRILGLTGRDARAVLNYQARLTEQGVTLERRGTLLSRYAEGLLKQRAEVIARTETMRALNAGQMALWRESIQHGMLDPAKTQRVWLTAADERVCTAICLPMHRQAVPLNKSFETGDGDEIESPPAHPRCRCRTVLEFDR